MEPIVKLAGVSKHFDRKPILKDISFQLETKDVLGLIGPNGAGKTTIIRLILGSLRADSGRVEVFGRPNDQEVRKNNREIGVVLDKSGFDGKATAEENILYYSRLYHIGKQETRARLEILTGALGLELNIKDRVNTYSKGMLQQLSLLRSLVHKPRLLILDEPTSGLDPLMQSVICRLLKNLPELYNVTIIVSSHNLKELENVCNKFLIINKGEQKLFTDKQIDYGTHSYKAIFYVGNGRKPDADLFKPYLEEKTLADYRITDGKIICEIDDPEFAYRIHHLLLTEKFSVDKMELRKEDIEDAYFSIIGENRYDQNIDIY